MRVKHLLISTLFILSLSSCGKSSSNDNGYTYGSVSIDTQFILNSSNVGSYFNIDINSGNNRVNGYVYNYRVNISAKGRYKTKGNVSIDFRVSFKYTYSAGSSKRTQNSTGRGTINISTNQTSASGNYSVRVVCHVSEISSMSYAGYFESASGSLVQY